MTDTFHQNCECSIPGPLGPALLAMGRSLHPGKTDAELVAMVQANYDNTNHPLFKKDGFPVYDQPIIFAKVT